MDIKIKIQGKFPPKEKIALVATKSELNAYKKMGYVVLEAIKEKKTTRRPNGEGSTPLLKWLWTRCFLLRVTDNAGHKIGDSCPIPRLSTGVVWFIYENTRNHKKKILNVL